MRVTCRLVTRMPAHFKGHMSPLSVQNVEGIVIHVGHGLLAFEWMRPADVPHRRLRAAHQDEEQSLVTLVFARYSSAKPCLRSPSEQSTTGMHMRIVPRRNRSGMKHSEYIPISNWLINIRGGLIEDPSQRRCQPRSRLPEGPIVASRTGG
jgi:hypothetical protein